MQTWRLINKNVGGFILMPGETVQHDGFIDATYSELPWQGDAANRYVRLVVSAAAFYDLAEDDGTGGARVTERTFTVGMRNVNPAKELVIREGRIDSLTAETAVVRRSFPSHTT